MPKLTDPKFVKELSDNELKNVTGGDGETITAGSWVKPVCSVGSYTDGVGWVKEINDNIATVKTFVFQKKFSVVSLNRTDNVSVSSLVYMPKPSWTDRIPSDWF